MPYSAVNIYLAPEATSVSGRKRVALADAVLNWFRDKNWSTKLFEGKANGFRLPIGKDYAQGYFLLTKEDLLALKSSEFNINLILQTISGDGGSASDYTTIEIKKLGITHTEAITGNIGGYPEQIVYLVELCDCRYIAHHAVLNKSYNVLTRDRTTDNVFLSSKNEGDLWTWTTLIEDIWDQLPAVFGTLETADADLPTSTPYNFKFQGVRAWDALHMVLDTIKHTLIRTYDGVFELVPLYTSDSALTTLVDNSTRRLIDPSQNVICISEAPEEVQVFFPNLDDAFQTSDDPDHCHPRDYWIKETVYKVSVSTAGFLPSGHTPVAGTKAVLHDNLPAIYDELGAPQNVAELTDRAEELAEQYVKSLTRSPIHNAYEGLIAFPPSNNLTSIAWYDLGFGITTEIHFSSRKSGGGGGYKPGPHSISLPCGDGLTLDTNHPGPVDFQNHPEYEALILVDLTENLAADGRALANVQFGDVSGTAITWDDTTLPHQIYVHDAHSRSYSQGTRLWAKYQQQVRQWVVIPTGGGGMMFAYAFIDQEKMCSTGNVTIGDFTIMATGVTVSPTPTTAVNVYNHKGVQDDRVLLIYNEVDERWEIINVLKKTLAVMVGVGLSSTHLYGIFRDIAAEWCEPVYNVDQIELTDCA